MVPNFSQLTIQRVCIHTVHKKERNDTHSVAEYDDAVITLDSDVHDTITERLNTYCGENSRSFELEIANFLEGSFFDRAHEMRQADKDGFVERTKQITHLLAESQTRGSIPASCLVVMDAVDEHALPVVVCIKAELTDALTREINEEGLSQLKKVEKLFMGKSEKFFKIGILYKRPPAAADEEEQLPHQQWGAILYDHQFRNNTRPAEYFWNRFLGLSVDNNDKIKLKKFYEDARAFLDESLSTDLEAKSKAIANLDSYISNENITEIDPVHVMETLIPADKRYDFNEAVVMNFERPFTKDDSLVKRKIARSQMVFPDNIVLTVPKSSVSRTKVEVIETQDDLSSLRLGEGYTIIRIKGSPDRFLSYE
jgi:hypothetical protein